MFVSKVVKGSFQNSDSDSLFALKRGEEGLQRCPLFFGLYKSIRSLHRLERSSFDTERVGGGVGRGVGDDGGLVVGNGREGWRTRSGWPLSSARRRDGDGK